MRTEILYEDRELTVVYKPAGLAVQTAKIGQPDVVSELKNYLSQSYLGVIHRLDQPVEGLLVFAKNKAAAAWLTGRLQAGGEGGAFHKRYYAALCGKPSEKEGMFVDELCKIQDNRAIILCPDNRQNTAEEKACRDAAQAKKAVLRYRVIQTTDVPAPLTLAEIEIGTGRFHQIRAQMSYHGLPLLGDTKYGDENSVELTRELGIKNVSLCACALEFPHPERKEKMSFRIKPRGMGFSFFSQACF